MKTLFLKIKVLGAFLALVRDPNKTDRIFKIGDMIRGKVTRDPPAWMRQIFSEAKFQELYAERFDPLIDLVELRKLPADTLGGALAKFLDLNGFEANAFPAAKEDTELAYFVTRARKTHDLWHVLSGYGTGVPGELALQGFMLGQYPVVISGIIIAGGMLHTIFYNVSEFARTFDLIAEGYQRGKQASPLILVKWENLWSEKLVDLRQKYGIQAAKSGETLFENSQADYLSLKPSLYQLQSAKH